MARVLVALGGNALGNNPNEQKQNAIKTAKEIVSLIKLGHEIIITHGNGPQVGMINIGFEEASKVNTNIPKIDFPECGAMSQGYIGFHLQNAIINELKKESLNHQVATIITQVEVDPLDPAFNNPTKPIGSFYSKTESDKLIHLGYTMKEDAGRGYRRVVASPKPINIIEIESIKTLIKNKHIVITVGGGGIPVIKTNDKYIGIDAVIDKDFASSKLSSLLEVDILMILTAVSHVYINYNKENQKQLNNISLNELKQYITNNEFSKGSMLPKIEAAVNFLEDCDFGKVIITELGKAELALQGNFGTVITNREVGSEN